MALVAHSTGCPTPAANRANAPMTPPPHISVVVCTHNRARYLARALASVLEQDTLPETYELLVIDNRSTDDTAEVLRMNQLAFDAVLCRPEGAPSSADKTPRYRAIAAGETAGSRTPVEIVAYIGDNILDYPSTSQAMRAQGEAAFAEFGVRWFMLPNPMYGSWQ